MLEGAACAFVRVLLTHTAHPPSPPSGVPDNGQAFEPVKAAAKESKAKPGESHAARARAVGCAGGGRDACAAAFPTASLPKPVKSSGAKGKSGGGGGGDGGKKGGK
jgi:hypothetical protein